MNTGEGDIGSLGRIETWQGRDQTDAFEGECGKVRRMIRYFYASAIMSLFLI